MLLPLQGVNSMVIRKPRVSLCLPWAGRCCPFRACIIRSPRHCHGHGIHWACSPLKLKPKNQYKLIFNIYLGIMFHARTSPRMRWGSCMKHRLNKMWITIYVAISSGILSKFEIFPQLFNVRIHSTFLKTARTHRTLFPIFVQYIPHNC